MGRVNEGGLGSRGVPRLGVVTGRLGDDSQGGQPGRWQGRGALGEAGGCCIPPPPQVLPTQSLPPSPAYGATQPPGGPPALARPSASISCVHSSPVFTCDPGGWGRERGLVF